MDISLIPVSCVHQTGSSSLTSSRLAAISYSSTGRSTATRIRNTHRLHCDITDRVVATTAGIHVVARTGIGPSRRDARCHDTPCDAERSLFRKAQAIFAQLFTEFT